ncbi:MAG: DNA starvation/stationary phase protection protein [Bacteroidetes bacterium]|nr:DNA starvation/stationary phase protection protein [Bacteroidota bacterium]
MDNTNLIGLNPEKAHGLAEGLNDLLANYQLFYMNVRGYHWNIKGDKFFELHVKFEELYNNLVLKIDEIAERVLTLGYTPMHAYEDYLKTSSIHANKNTSDGKECVKSIVNSFQIVIEKQRHLLRLSAELEDEGTNALMSDYIREQEKLVWMYASFLDA